MQSPNLPNKTLGAALSDTAALYPDRTAFFYADCGLRQTWREFEASVDRVAKGLIALGIRPDEKIAIWATNVPYWLEVAFAAARIGVVLVTVNPSFRDSELEYILRRSDAVMLFLTESYKDHDFTASLHGIFPGLGSSDPNVPLSEGLPFLRRICTLSSSKHEGMLTIDELIALGDRVSDEELAERSTAVSADDVVNMQFTSGTTGFPKGVMLTHRNVVCNGFSLGEAQGLTHEDRLCMPAPLFHCLGLVVCTIACVTHGTEMAILESYSPIRVLETIESERCTMFSAVPAMFIGILEHRQFSRYDLTSLRGGVMSGSVCPEPVVRRAVTDMHMSGISLPYGLTENSPGMTSTTPDDTIEDRCATVGRALPGIEIAIREPGTGKMLPADTVGEICCRGYSVMKGYYKDPEGTSEAIDGDGWLHTGDLGTMDARGYLRITGRLKDMIVRGGENVYPREIEEYLLGMPGVQDVQIVALPSRKYGEELAAFIISADGRDIKAEDVRNFCRGHISWYKIPRYVTTVKEYPLTGSGKIQKNRLRGLAKEIFTNVK